MQMALVQRGLVELDAPVNNYLDRYAQIATCAASSAKATVRRVANHSAGLPLHYNFYYKGELEGGLLPHRDETIRRYAATVYRPGERWQYSNLGFAILDRVISRAQQGSVAAADDSAWAHCLERDILRPLGLQHTAVWPLGPSLAPHAALRYPPRSAGSDMQMSSPQPLEDYDCDHPGAASVWSSVHDVLRFGMFHCSPAEGGPLSRATRREMQRSTTLTGESAGAGYGVGFMVTPTAAAAAAGQSAQGREPAYTLVHHGGGMMGVSTMLMMVPSEELVVAVLCNGRGPSDRPQPATAITEAVLSALLPGYSTPAAAAAPVAATNSILCDPSDSMRVGTTLAGTWRGYIVLPIDDRSDRGRSDTSAKNGQLNQTRRRRLVLRVNPNGSVMVELAGQRLAPHWDGRLDVDDQGASGGVPLEMGRLMPQAGTETLMLSGYFAGSAGTADAERRAHELHLSLLLRQGLAEDTTADVLEGGVTAMTEQQSGFRPAPVYVLPRAGNALTYYCRLQRDSPSR